MNLPIYLRFELRTNAGELIRAVERLAVIDTNQTLDDLIDIIKPWAAEAGEVFAIGISLEGEDKKELKKAAIRASIANAI